MFMHLYHIVFFLTLDKSLSLFKFSYRDEMPRYIQIRKLWKTV